MNRREFLGALLAAPAAAVGIYTLRPAAAQPGLYLHPIKTGPELWTTAELQRVRDDLMRQSMIHGTPYWEVRHSSYADAMEQMRVTNERISRDTDRRMRGIKAYVWPKK